MSQTLKAPPPASAEITAASRVLNWLDAVLYTVLAIPLRLAVATIFWNSAMTKLANWETAVTMFAKEYKLPLLAPEVAA